MSLPPGFLDELRNRLSLAQVVGRKVIWDMRRSNQGKGDMWAPCPFHQEKSASFHVDDRKGYYYCFGCHAKGDAVTFVKETENVGFLEAVEILAREAGMQMPARDPQATARADRRSQLIAVMDEAVKHYRLMLRSAAGGAARDYLARRRLSEAGQERFGIGFAPDSRTGLVAALTAKGIAPEMVVAAGLAAVPEGGGAPYDRFRGRIIFPIRDARGRTISLGGRAMDPNARAKYLNGPETEIFDKGRNLYNLAPAREAAGKGQRVIVVEGYMDVIALAEAGFNAAVAPLGTAVTEEQLRLLWRITDEPVIALDGDAAGMRAAVRVIDLALPLLEAGKGLRFALLPGGQDPDDLIKTQGAGAMQAALDQALPMVRLLWEREYHGDGQTFDSPERRAALEKRLRQSIVRIRDPDIRRHYGEAIRQFLFEAFRPRNWAPEFRSKKGSGRGPLRTTRSSLLARATSDSVADVLREMVVLAVLLKNPDTVSIFEHDLDTLHMDGEGHQSILLAILENFRHETDMGLLLKVSDIVGREQVAELFHAPYVSVIPAVVRPGDEDLARDTVAEQLARLSSNQRWDQEMGHAVDDIDGLADEGLTYRVSKVTEARNAAGKTMSTDSADLGEDRAALSRHLQNLIDGEVWRKNRR